ncbi:hypothetical protein Tco_0243738, partial [Tanacetum coccineum]
MQVTNNVKNVNANRSTYNVFMACKPRDFDEKGGAIALTWWIEKTESARGHEAAFGMTWEEFKALLMEEFCLSNEIEKYIHGLAPQIYKMIRVTQPATIQSAILKNRALTDEAV